MTTIIKRFDFEKRENLGIGQWTIDNSPRGINVKFSLGVLLNIWE